MAGLGTYGDPRPPDGLIRDGWKAFETIAVLAVLLLLTAELGDNEGPVIVPGPELDVGVIAEEVAAISPPLPSSGKDIKERTKHAHLRTR